MYKTLEDLNKDKDQTKPKKPGHFTGNERSGQETIHPETDDIVKKAKENSQKYSEDEREKNQKDINCKITLYSNGFKVDDGEFREYGKPENKEFMDQVKQGVVPQELRGKYKDGVSVGLEDKRDEEFIPPPPPKYIAFSGDGVNLGGGSSQQQAKVDIKAGGQIKVDQNKPSTQIQVRLHNGQAVTVEINNQDTVESLYSHIARIAPAQNGFQIIAGFPPKPIQDLSQTVEEADLLDSRVTQKLL